MKSIREFTDSLCKIRKRDFTLEHVARHVAENPVEPESLSPYLHYAPTHYTRNLIYKCELFEIIAICWEIGQVSRIHNHHNQRCWMAVPIGRLVVQNYRVVDMDEDTGYCRLEESTRVTMDPGNPSYVEEHMPVHAVLNPPEFEGRAASLHIYSLPYDRCLVYSLEKNSYSEVPLFYDTEYGGALNVS